MHLTVLCYFESKSRGKGIASGDGTFVLWELYISKNIFTLVRHFHYCQECQPHTSKLADVPVCFTKIDTGSEDLSTYIHYVGFI